MPHPAEDLLRVLFVELFQTEESAIAHPRTEAERLAGTTVAAALLAVAMHAERMRPELERLAQAEGIERAESIGTKIGHAFSAARDLLFDRGISREKSYRGTLLGMRHGVDLVSLVRATAEVAGRPAIVAFCDAWLSERPTLVELVARELPWFALDAAQAMERSTKALSEDGDARDEGRAGTGSEPAAGESGT